MRPSFASRISCLPILLAALGACSSSSTSNAADAAVPGADGGGPGLDGAAPLVDAGSPSDATTATPDAGDAASPYATEIGFLDVPPQATGATYPARIFYAFQPADEDAAHKPLVVFSNGGPGDATTRGFLVYGTGRTTIDVNAAPLAAPIANQSSWTAFANLLYLDARQTGFSYGLGAPDAAAAPCTFVPMEDAADDLYALLGFFDAHEGLRANSIVLAFESYGGTRATWMLDLLLRYGTEASKVGPGLQAKVQAHLDKVFPQMAGNIVDSATIATQFGAQVLIEPVVLGLDQYQRTDTLVQANPQLAAAKSGTADPYDVREPTGWSGEVATDAISHLSSGASSTALLGVDLASIPVLQPAARAQAFHPSTSNDAPINQAMAARFGALQAGDAYYVGQQATCEDWAGDNEANAAFYANLRQVKTFITDGQYDEIVVSQAIADVLHADGYDGTVDTAPRTGVDRPGWIHVTFPADAGAAQTAEIRFPPYAAGHYVTFSQAAELRDDVQAWLATP